MQRFFFAVLLAVTSATGAAAQGDASAKNKAWIILDFVLKNGTAAQMAFDRGGMTESECKEDLLKPKHRLVEAAIQREPRLATAKFSGARCVMSADDPIKQSSVMR